MSKPLRQVQDKFKEAMANVATPVAVVSSVDGIQPVGTTVSAFTALSMNPPMVLVSLDKGSQTLEQVTSSKRFGLNILASDQQSAAVRFAGKGGAKKFEGIRWDIDHSVPRIPGIAGWVACVVETIVEGGDHMVVLGKVVAAEHVHEEPLTYHGRVFGTHAALAPANQ